MRSNGGHVSPFERIRRVNASGAEFWSSREFARVLGYSDYRNFEQVIQKARLACFNSGQKVEDHFVDVTELIEIGKGGQRAVGRGKRTRKEQRMLDLYRQEAQGLCTMLTRTN